METVKSKVDLGDVTFVIPVRIDTLERLDNLHIVTDYILSTCETNIVVLEATHRKTGILEKILHPNIKFMFEKDNLEIFHRTHYINKMVKIVDTPYIAVWDSDVIISAMQFDMSQVYSIPGASFPNNYAISINAGGGNVMHTVRPLEVQTGLYQFGISITFVRVFDSSMPQGQQYYNVEWASVQGIFTFGIEDTYGQPGYFGYGNNGISYGYDAYQYGYEYDGYNHGYYGYGYYSY